MTRNKLVALNDVWNAVQVTVCSLVLVNALFYVALMHVIYTIVLHNMGYKVMDRVPRWVKRLAFRGADL